MKNPLSVAFGQILRKNRDLLGLTSNDIAHDIGIQPSFYRIIESGHKSLHISKALNIVDAFHGKLDFDGVVKVLSTISVLETYGQLAEKTKRHYLDGIKDGIQKLVIYDEEKLGKLFVKWDDTFFDELKKEGINFSDWLRNTDFLNDLNYLLCDHNNFGKFGKDKLEEYTLSFFSDLPSIYLESINDLKENLLELPVKIGFESLSSWEEKNRKKFVSQRVLIYNERLITRQKNLDMYLYLHFWEQKFKRLDLAYLNKTKPQLVGDKFFQNLKTSLLKKEMFDKSETTDEISKKVKFYNFQGKDIIDNLSSKLTPNIKEVNAIWSFTFENNISIGFAAKLNESNSDLVTGVSMSYLSTLLFNQEFDLLKKNEEV